jgi:dextranase
VTARIVALDAGRTWAPPGTTLRVRVRVRVDHEGPPPHARTAWLRLELLDVARVVGMTRKRIRLMEGEQVPTVPIALPDAPRHGYGVRATLETVLGPSTLTTAVEAIDGWWEAPRHLAHTDFAPDVDGAALVAAARAWHVTVTQAYDWMYRHYQYASAHDPFLDALGRLVSHASVRRLVRAGRAAGIATLAYGAVYGAEPEYVVDHPDERVFDDAGNPLSLGGAFFINDLRAGSPWRRRLLEQYEVACRGLGFDGIHMDTYGPPHEALGADGGLVLFRDLYPALIEEAAARVASARPGSRVLFNCVEGFPLDAVAGSPVAALYLELWPPDDTYADLVRWIERSRSLGAGRATVIAAYVPALRDAGTDPVARSAAIESAALLTSVIHAAGAFHHVLAEGDRLLVEGYYPAAIALRPMEARELRAAWVFSARYLHLLSDPAADSLDVSSVRLRDADDAAIPVSTVPRRGAVWVSGARTPSGPVLSLVDLRHATDDHWTSAQPPGRPNRGWRLAIDELDAGAGGGAPALAMSPWARSGEPVRVADAGAGWSRLPAFRRWILVHRPATTADAS